MLHVTYVAILGLLNRRVRSICLFGQVRYNVVELRFDLDALATDFRSRSLLQFLVCNG